MNQFPKPIEVKATKPYSVWVKYDDGKSGEVDLSHLEKLKPFQSWHDLAFFQNVFIAENGRCIAWNEELEICPNTLYLELIGKKFEEYASY